MAMRTMNPVHEASTCAVAATAEIVGAKWTALLVHDLSEGPRRFSELERSCKGIRPRTLQPREAAQPFGEVGEEKDRKSTTLNSNHTVNSYAVLCIKKKN